MDFNASNLLLKLYNNLGINFMTFGFPIRSKYAFAAFEANDLTMSLYVSMMFNGEAIEGNSVI
jgi:hypothetical protein